MKIPNNYQRLESCSKEELIEMCIKQDKNEGKLMKIIGYRKRRAKDNQEEEIKKLKEDTEHTIKFNNKIIGELKLENKRLKSDVSVYKSQMNAYKEKYLALLKANTELVEENRKLKEELGVWLNANKILRMHDAKMEYDNKKLKEENELLKQCLDEMMFKADVVNIKIQGELCDYCYVRSDKKFKLNVKD